MSLLLSLSLVWPLAVASPAMPDTLLGPLHTAPAEDGPAVLFRPLRAPSLVALRLSVRVDEPAGMEGSGMLLQELARVRLESNAARYGARAEMRRTPTHLIYTITGSATDFPALIDILQQAIAEPRRAGAEVGAVWAAVRENQLEEAETPGALVRLRLRQRLFPGLSASAALTENGPGLVVSQLRAFWSQTFQPDRMHLVIVGDVAKEAALSAFHGWEAPERERLEQSRDERRTAEPKPEVHFPWVGLGYPAEGVEPAALTVAAALIERRLAAGGLQDVRSELWWSEDRRAIVVMASARPDPASTNGGRSSNRPTSAAALRERLQDTVKEVANLATEADLEAARGRIRRDLLMSSRTPHGLAELLGEFYDRTGEPTAAARFLVALDELRLAALRRGLRALPDAPPIRTEVTR